jgi:hypothetical protein
MQLATPLTIDDEDKEQLALALDCKPDELPQKLVGHAQAALDEYVAMYLGRGTPTQAREIFENRLALLMTRALHDGLPSDDDVARLFNISRSQARTLLRNTISRRRFLLADTFKASAKTALEAANGVEAGFVLTLRSAYLAEGLNLELDRLNKGSPPLTPIRNQVSRYLAAPSSYDLLCAAYGAAPVAAG